MVITGCHVNTIVVLSTHYAYAWINKERIYLYLASGKNIFLKYHFCPDTETG